MHGDHKRKRDARHDQGEEVGRVLAEHAPSLLGLPPLPGLGMLGGPVARKVLEERERRISKALKAAERLSGKSREDLEEILESDPASLPMLVKLLHFAGANGHDPVLTAMGESYARALKTPERLAHEEVLLLSLDGLEELHIRVLRHLESVVERSPEGKVKRLTPREIAEQTKLDVDAVGLALAGLVSRSLVQNPYGGFGGGEAYALNAAGYLVIAAIRQTAKT